MTDQYITSHAVDTLARTIWAEARGEGEAGMEAVAAVIVNRAQHPSWWGRDVTSCCLQPWQFSCWNADDPNRSKLMAVTTLDTQFAAALAIAQRAVNGELPDPTRGADSYYSLFMHSPPAWAARGEFTCIIGNHSFYRLQIPAPSGEPDAACHAHINTGD